MKTLMSEWFITPVVITNNQKHILFKNSELFLSRMNFRCIVRYFEHQFFPVVNFLEQFLQLSVKNSALCQVGEK